MTNMARWSDASSLQADWADRARFAARFIAPGQIILDLGCGAMDLERFAAPAVYLPVDVAMRDTRTRVVDLNTAPIPGDLLERADIVTLLGVLEYLDDVPGLFRQIAAAGKPMLFSYCATERHAGVDRGANDWVNAFSTADLIAMLDAAGMEPSHSYVFNAAQILVVTRPKGEGATRARGSGRPSLVVAGHYGRGNCGDEALLQCVYEAFRETHDIVVSVDEHGAYAGFWNWYPYDRCRVIHRTDVAPFQTESSLAGIIVGGGGLPLGCAANQVVEARLGGKRAALAGVDDWPVQDAGWIESYARFFDFVAFRTARACDAAGRSLGSTAHMHGGDWALLLPTDNAADITVDHRRVLVTVREFDLRVVPHGFGQSIQAMLDTIRKRGWVPTFLPFCPEDERFLGEVGLDQAAPMERHWWNPRRMKQVVASSGMMLSVGRLHPMVFAASACVPVACVTPPLRLEGNEGALPKLEAMADELGIVLATLPDGLEDFLRDPRPADPGKVAAATERARRMIERLRALIAG